eukprot:TCONS_00064739-protein
MVGQHRHYHWTSISMKTLLCIQGLLVILCFHASKAQTKDCNELITNPDAFTTSRQCHFPFYYRRKWYYTCAKSKLYNFCSVDRVYRGKWAACTRATPDQCQNPFFYKGVKYEGCSTRFSPVPWCSLDRNHKRGKSKFAYCPKNLPGRKYARLHLQRGLCRKSLSLTFDKPVTQFRSGCLIYKSKRLNTLNFVVSKRCCRIKSFGFYVSYKGAPPKLVDVEIHGKSIC